MRAKIISVLIVGLMVSCGTGRKGAIINKEAELHNNTLTYAVNIKEFPLDEETSSLAILYLQYIDRDSLKYFSFLNESNYKIYFHDYDSHSLVNKVE